MYTKKSLQTTLSFFWIDFEDLGGIYLKSLQTSTWFFKGILKGLLLDSLVFVVTLYPGWGCTFVVIFFCLCMENVVIGVGQSYFTATKSWPNSPPQIPTPILKSVSFKLTLKSNAFFCECQCPTPSHREGRKQEKNIKKEGMMASQPLTALYGK